MAIIVKYQGDVPLPTLIPVTVNGAAYALDSSNGVSGVAAMLSANGVDQWGTWRTCTIVGDGTSGQVQVPWQASDFAANGSYVLYIRLYWNGGANYETLPPDVVQVPARTVNNAPPQPLGATPPPDATIHTLTLTGGMLGRLSTGAGVPTLPGGQAPQTGDYFFRTDLPGSANSRIYVCTVGGATPTWVGIV